MGCTIQGAPAQTAVPPAPSRMFTNDNGAEDDDDDDSTVGAAATSTGVPAQRTAMPDSGTSPNTCTDTRC